MSVSQLYILGSTPALRIAGQILARDGCPVIDHPTPEVSHLLLDVPSFQADGRLKGGRDLVNILEMLPESVTVIGGKLRHHGLKGYKAVDLLEDPFYTAKNADITARCAIRVAAGQLRRSYDALPVLVIGWGRIGKCLCRHLSAIGADVIVYARKETDRALAAALGYTAVSLPALSNTLGQYRVIFNTAPEIVLTREMAGRCRSCQLIDLASTPGIESESAVRALGLPGSCVPESSGELIAETVKRICLEV